MIDYCLSAFLALGGLASSLVSDAQCRQITFALGLACSIADEFGQEASYTSSFNFRALSKKPQEKI
jgi:hypothetical protein